VSGAAVVALIALVRGLEMNDQSLKSRELPWF
jgi:hypothetical protein